MKKMMVFILLIASLVAAGCTTTQKGALGGAALGAGAGAIIGHNTHHGRGLGALVGGLVGGLAGALAGDAYEEHQENRAIRQNNAAQNYSSGGWSSYDQMWE